VGGTSRFPKSRGLFFLPGPRSRHRDRLSAARQLSAMSDHRTVASFPRRIV